MVLLNKFNIEKISFFFICLFPLTIIVGQAAISLNYFVIIFCFFFLLSIKDFRFLVKKYFFFISPFFLCLMISQILNYENYKILNFDKSILYLKNFFLFFVLIFSLRKDNYKKIFFYIILICCIFVALDNYIQFFFERDVFGILKSGTRLTGPFGDNEYVSGSYLAKFSILILPIFLLNKKFSNLFIFSILVITLFFSVLITGERASTLLFIIGTLIFYFLNDKSIKKSVILLSVFILIGSLMTIYNNTIKYKFLQTSYQIGVIKYFDPYLDIPDHFKNYEGRGFFDSNHGAHFLAAFEIWKQNKLIGVGTKNFSQECSKKKYEKIASLNYKNRCSNHPHNFYLELLSENGIFGLTLFLLILFKIYKSFKYSSVNKNTFLNSSLSQTVVILWPIISTGSLISNFNGVFIWINLALLISICEYGFKYEKK